MPTTQDEGMFYSFNILTKNIPQSLKTPLKNIQFHIIYNRTYRYRFQYNTNIAMLEIQWEGMM